MSTVAFVKQWSEGKNSFLADNPNASLVYVVKKGEADQQGQAIFQLANPQYNAARQTLAYQIHSVQADSNMKDYKNLKDVALFIDTARFCAGAWCS